MGLEPKLRASPRPASSASSFRRRVLRLRGRQGFTTPGAHASALSRLRRRAAGRVRARVLELARLRDRAHHARGHPRTNRSSTSSTPAPRRSRRGAASAVAHGAAAGRRRDRPSRSPSSARRARSAGLSSRCSTTSTSRVKRAAGLREPALRRDDALLPRGRRPGGGAPRGRVPRLRRRRSSARAPRSRGSGRRAPGRRAARSWTTRPRSGASRRSRSSCRR